MGKRSNFDRVPRDFSGEKNPAYSHGHNCLGSRSTEYEIWAGVRKRVNNPKDKLYPYYGGRGISYDPRWEDFSVFLADVGCRPSSDHSLDRIDNNKGYFPDNVRWATRKEQSCNRRNNLLFEGMVLKDWCASVGFNYKTVWRWVVKEGKSPDYVKGKGEELWGKGRTT